MEKKQLNFKISKRYKDIFDLYVHRGESTPFTIGSLVVFAFCFVLLVVTTFFQFDFSNTWLEHLSGAKEALYTPQTPIMLFIIYLLGRNYSILLFISYLLVGLFLLPTFAFGGGMGYAQNYIFGYFLGFFVAILTVSYMLKRSIGIKMRTISSFVGDLSIHLTGFIYCLILAIIKIIDFSLIPPVVKALSTDRILYDIIFSLIVLLIAPYIKNVFWVCMKPKSNEKKSKKSRHRK